jgi:PKD repeat protein
MYAKFSPLGQESMAKKPVFAQIRFFPVFFILVAILVTKVYPAFSAKVFSKDQSSSSMTKPVTYIQNTGTDTLKSYYWYYYFTVEGNKSPVLQQDYVRNCTFRFDSLGNSNWRLRFSSTTTVPPGTYFPDNTNGEQIEIHYSDWSTWDRTNDYSYANNGSFIENNKIVIHLASNDSIIYGVPPPYAAKPVAKFFGSPTSGFDSITVHFTDSSTGGIASRLWSFSDGTTDTAANPVHTFKTIGNFSVKLVLSGIGGKDSLTKTDFITVAAGKPQVKFSGTPVSGIDTLTVRFHDSSTGNITSRLWRFGDNLTDTSKNPVHKYSSTSAFSVQLIVYGPGGSDSLTKTNYINVTPPKPKAAFGASALSGIDSLTVNFIDSSAGIITSRVWTFSDNTTDTAKNPIHFFQTTGTYSIKLRVTGPGGIDSLTKINYIIVSPPKPKAVFGASPLVGNDTLTVQFFDSSTGKITSRIWYFNDGTTDTAKNPLHFFSAVGSYSIKLVVTGSGGADSLTKTNLIVVNSGIPKVRFGVSQTSGADSLNAQFFDSSTGTITERLWKFGDGSTSTEKNPLHLYDSIGSFTVSLKISGPGGKDSIVKTNYISITPTKARANFSAAPDSGAKPLSVQFIDSSSGTISGRIWNFGDNKTSTEKSPQHVYTATGKFTVSLVVSGAGGVDTVTKKNVVTVTDSFPPINNLRISGKHLGNDSVEISLDSTFTIDTTTTQLVGIWYGFSDSVNFQDLLNTTWFQAATVKENSHFSTVIRDAQIGKTIRSIYCSVALKGPNGKLSIHVDTIFVADGQGILNPINLSSRALSHTSIVLNWNKASGFDSLRIWTGLSPVPFTATDPGTGFKKISVPTSDIADTITGLFAQTTYYFGAQVYANNAWSYVTGASRTGVMTLADPDTSKIVNNIKLTKKYFDPSSNSIKVYWTMDSTQNQNYLTVNYSVGISISFSGFPTDTSVSKQVIPVRRLSDSAIVNINETIVFDTTCYVSLWLKRNTGVWAFPTADSKDTLHIASFTWQKITYFKRDASHDTVYAFNNKVRLWNDVPIDPTVDTLVFWKPDNSLLDGFIPVSAGFYFQKHIPSQPFFIGLRCDLTPGNFSLEKARIFRYSNGNWLVEKNFAFDPASGYVWIKTQEIIAPFIAMIDTLTPRCSVVSDIKAPVIAGQPVTDTFIVNDNVVNMDCFFHYARGGFAFDQNHRIDTVLAARDDTLIFTTPEGFASEDNGLRASLIIGDGTNWDTAWVSRRVIRQKLSDVINTNAMKWMPLRTTAVPDNPNADNALRTFAIKGVWKYDSTTFRLFRWCSITENAQNLNKWVEYSDPLKNIFTFSPGNLIWIKSKKTTLLDFGSAITPSLLENYDIDLAPGTWTDFALPFKFDVVLGDILDATIAGDSTADSLQFYVWDFDAESRYITQPIYLPGMTDPSITNRDTVLLSKDKTGYSIYNPLAQAFTLKVPPLPSAQSLSVAKLGKKSLTQQQQGWTIKITGQTKSSGQVSPVFCGYAPGKAGLKLFPAPPSFNNVAIGVSNDKKGFFGHAIARGTLASEGGVTFNLAFRNTSKQSETIEYALGIGHSLPDGMTAKIFNQEKGDFDTAASAFSVSIPPSDCIYRNLVVGGKEYLAKMRRSLQLCRLDLIGAFPNPFGRIVRIRYTLPQQGVGRIAFSITNLLGRVEYRQTIECRNKSGLHEMQWNGRNLRNQKVAAGLYLIRMTALNDQSNVIGTFEKRITFVP